MPKFRDRCRQGAYLTLLVLAGCATQSAPPMQPSPVPPLDSALAAPCPLLPPAPEELDFDAREVWMLDVIELYGTCAIRHRATVAAWPK